MSRDQHADELPRWLSITLLVLSGPFVVACGVAGYIAGGI